MKYMDIITAKSPFEKVIFRIRATNDELRASQGKKIEVKEIKHDQETLNAINLIETIGRQK